jgi:hypothetical protein
MEADQPPDESWGEWLTKCHIKLMRTNPDATTEFYVSRETGRCYRDRDEAASEISTRCTPKLETLLSALQCFFNRYGESLWTDILKPSRTKFVLSKEKIEEGVAVSIIITTDTVRIVRTLKDRDVVDLVFSFNGEKWEIATETTKDGDVRQHRDLENGDVSVLKAVLGGDSPYKQSGWKTEDHIGVSWSPSRGRVSSENYARWGNAKFYGKRIGLAAAAGVAGFGAYKFAPSATEVQRYVKKKPRN